MEITPRNERLQASGMNHGYFRRIHYEERTPSALYD
jgi:hypothetical protein